MGVDVIAYAYSVPLKCCCMVLICCRYDQKLTQARHFGTKRGVAVGLSTGFALSIVVGFAGTCFW